MMIRVLFLILACSLLAACSGTTVVLVPDAKGKVGQVELKTEGGKTMLSKANESTQASKSKQAPSKPELLSDAKINDMFAETLAKQPAAPEHILFHFAVGSADILPEDKPNLAKAKSVIQARNSCDISVIGHSDTVGDNKMNKGISLQRAENVISAMINKGVKKECMDKRYYGENDLLIKTADNVYEPQNRRVEIEIR